MAMVSNGIPRLVLKDTRAFDPAPAFNDDVIQRLLVELQNLIARYPFVARTLAAAFVAEGHRFAQTPEGREWYDILSRSELIRRSQLIWETYGLDNLLESTPEHLPGIWMDTFAAGAMHTDLESMLSMMLVQGLRDGSLSA
jgi:hypothetical protein